MPRHYEIDSAWRASIKREPNGRQTVRGRFRLRAK